MFAAHESLWEFQREILYSHLFGTLKDWSPFTVARQGFCPHVAHNAHELTDFSEYPQFTSGEALGLYFPLMFWLRKDFSLILY